MYDKFGDSPESGNEFAPGPHAVARAAIAAFMERTGISVAGLQCDPDGMVERRVREIVKTWDIGNVGPTRLDGHIFTGAHIGAAAYGHTPFEVQVHIALLTMILSSIDDFNIEPVALEEFMSRLHTGTPQRHPLLQHLVEVLAATEKFFSPFTSKAIVTSSISYLHQNFIDKEIENMPLNQAAMPYIEYKRIYNGAAEAYGYLVWYKFTFPDITSYIQTIPDTMLLADYVNDIFSFYKEELVGETANYVHDRARVTGKTASEALFDVVDDTVAAVERIRTILQEGEERAVLERWMAGYVLFHFLSPRYKLMELTGTQYL